MPTPAASSSRGSDSDSRDSALPPAYVTFSLWRQCVKTKGKGREVYCTSRSFSQSCVWVPCFTENVNVALFLELRERKSWIPLPVPLPSTAVMWFSDNEEYPNYIVWQAFCCKIREERREERHDLASLLVFPDQCWVLDFLELINFCLLPLGVAIRDHLFKKFNVHCIILRQANCLHVLHAWPYL